jgi:hypothetical protein
MATIEKPGETGNNLTLYQFFTPSYALMQMATLELQELLEHAPMGAHAHLVLSQVTPKHYIGTLTLFSRWGNQSVRSSDPLPEEALRALCAGMLSRIEQQRAVETFQDETWPNMPMWARAAG